MVTFPFPLVSTEETSPPAGVLGAADSGSEDSGEDEDSLLPPVKPCCSL